MPTRPVLILSLLSLAGLLVGCGKTETPAKTATTAQSTPAQTPQPAGGSIKTPSPGDDQPVTVIGGSVMISSASGWTADNAGSPTYFTYNHNYPVRAIDLFTSDETTADAENSVVLAPISGQALMIQIQRKQGMAWNDLYKFETASTHNTLKLIPQSPKKFTRHLVRKSEKMERLVITNATMMTGSLTDTPCTIASNVVTCALANKDNLGFVLHVFN